MKVVFSCIFLALSLICVSSCEDENGNLEVNPSNLTVDVTVADDGSGIIDVVAKADNTIGYEFYVGDNGSQEPVYNSTGIFSYTYAESGIYTFETRAIGSSGKYLKEETILTVQVGDGPIDPEDGYITPISYPNMDIVWNDEFSGNNLDNLDWTYEIGTGNSGWGNNELQYYREENTSVVDGYLIIEARKESFGGSSYTSSRLVTKDKQTFKYGRIDIRALLPKGQGIWPALWMLGNNISSVGWPACGEIDIMEMVGGTGDNTSYGTIHWDNNGSYACTCDQDNSYSLANSIFADEFHVFSIIWDSNAIQWFVDDKLFKTADITPDGLSEFHNNAFFIFNLAVGGNWPGSPNSNTIFPQQLKVDYIRVFQDK